MLTVINGGTTCLVEVVVVASDNKTVLAKKTFTKHNLSMVGLDHVGGGINGRVFHGGSCYVNLHPNQLYICSKHLYFIKY